MNDLLRGTSIYLIGMMGSGKTSLGRELATKMRYGFIDTDALIAQVTKQSIAELFASIGEAKFRQLETQVLSQVCANIRFVVATGGGIILQRQNWSYLHHGLVIWLDAPVEVLYQRLVSDTTRPLLQNTDLRARLKILLQQRQALYSQADLHVAVNGSETPAQLATQVLAEIPTVLKPPK